MTRFRLYAALAILGFGLTAVPWILTPTSPFVVLEPIPSPPTVTQISTTVETLNSVGDAEVIRKTIPKLAPLHRVLGKPEPADWLAHHEEPGQSFAQYIKCKPVTPTGEQAILYVQPLGDFSDEQTRIIQLSAEYLSLYFSRLVNVLEPLPESIIPKRAIRNHPLADDRQILTPFVLEELLKPRLPNDAAAYIAFTACDLYPGEGWNFVYGQASLYGRVGVWSIYRNGDPSGGSHAFQTCLLRTLKTATHETGHMFSMRHCTAYECNMCGSNNMTEADRFPLYLCPECHAKICWATGADPVKRYRAFANFCATNGLQNEADFFLRSITAIEQPD